MPLLIYLLLRRLRIILIGLIVSMLFSILCLSLLVTTVILSDTLDFDILCKIFVIVILGFLIGLAILDFLINYYGW